MRVGGDLVAGPRFEIARDGASRQEALRTITAAWERIPAGYTHPDVAAVGATG